MYIQTIRKTEQNETNLFTRRGENLLQKKNKTKQKHSMEVYSVPNDFFNDYFLESLLEKWLKNEFKFSKYIVSEFHYIESILFEYTTSTIHFEWS